MQESAIVATSTSSSFGKRSRSLSTEPFRSITVVLALESASNLDTYRICLFLSKDGERRTECREVQFATFTSISFGKRWTSFLQA